jgi:hypothetical protein
MRRLLWCVVCLLALTTLGGCLNNYDTLVHPGEIYQPGTQ